MSVAVDIFRSRSKSEAFAAIRRGNAVHPQALALRFAGERCIGQCSHAAGLSIDYRPDTARRADALITAPQLKAARIKPKPPLAGHGDYAELLPRRRSAHNVKALPQQHPRKPFCEKRVHTASAAVSIFARCLLHAVKKLCLVRAFKCKNPCVSVHI